MTASTNSPLTSISLGVPVVDSHSHVIADDPVRYPLAPMGGKQSDWSKDRPVNGVSMESPQWNLEAFNKVFHVDRDLMTKIVKKTGMTRDS